MISFLTSCNSNGCIKVTNASICEAIWTLYSDSDREPYTIFNESVDVNFVDEFVNDSLSHFHFICTYRIQLSRSGS